jgi:hypothetical protein
VILEPELDERTIQRIDALAKAHGTTREEMIARLVFAGLEAKEEAQARDVAAAAPMAGLGWALVLFAALMVAVACWLLFAAP